MQIERKRARVKVFCSQGGYMIISKYFAKFCCKGILLASGLIWKQREAGLEWRYFSAKEVISKYFAKFCCKGTVLASGLIWTEREAGLQPMRFLQSILPNCVAKILYWQAVWYEKKEKEAGLQPMRFLQSILPNFVAKVFYWLAVWYEKRENKDQGKGGCCRYSAVAKVTSANEAVVVAVTLQKINNSRNLHLLYIRHTYISCT